MGQRRKLLWVPFQFPPLCARESEKKTEIPSPPQATEPRILICNVFYNSNLSLDVQSLGGLS